MRRHCIFVSSKHDHILMMKDCVEAYLRVSGFGLYGHWSGILPALSTKELIALLHY